MSEEEYEWMGLNSFMVMSWIAGWMAGVDCMISPDGADDPEASGAALCF
jgi:hypothetical protein